MKQKVTDSVIDEIHRTRREISERFDGDLMAIAKDAARRQSESNRPEWTPEASGEIPLRGGDTPVSSSTPG